MVWLRFAVAASIIAVAGAKLSQYGDIIARRRGLSRAWMGLIGLALITSLPELVTSLGATLRLNAPNLALGDLLGSNCFNMMIVALLFLSVRPSAAISWGDRSSLLSSACSVILAGVVIGSVWSGWTGNLWNVGFDSMIIFIIYLIGIRLIFKYEYKDRGQKETDLRSNRNVYPVRGLKRVLFPHSASNGVYLGFLLAAVAIIGAGIWLAHIGDGIARTTGWGRTFVGTLFLAITTSFPELVVALTAMRLGALDMAIGNLLGSNTFNLTIIPLIDVFYRPHAILSQGSRGQVLVASLGIVLTLMAILGFAHRAKKVRPRLSWDTISMLLVYFLSIYVLFRIG